jgi:dihydrolipoamide dehydrogenase
MPGFDVVIIGSGPGGYVAAIRAAQLGLGTALVEKDPRFGGTCLHRGCIPTKALLHDAALYDRVREAGRFGVQVEGVKLDFEAVRKHKDRVVRKLSLGVEGLLKKNKVSLFPGFGKVVRPGLVDAGGKEVAAGAIVVATGSGVKTIPGMEPDGKKIITSDQILELESVPKSLIVIGAGAVGVEFASIYSRFGSEVTVVEMMPRILPLEDSEVGDELQKILGKRGLRFFTGAKVASVRPEGEVTLTAGGKEVTLSAEKVLVAVGRKPLTEGIGLENTRAKVERGYVRVDDWNETAEPGVFAIGDVVLGRPPLAHVASAQGILVAEKLANREVRPIRYDRVPSVAYGDPQVASAGLTEKAAREQGFAVKCSRFPFAASGMASVKGENEGFVKVVAETKYGEVLGVHILHAHAADLIAEAVAALNGEMTVDDLAHAVHPHPTLSEALAEAAHAFYGHAIHL